MSEAKEYLFRCKTNPNGPLLVLHTYREAKEMKGHPDYERVDAYGEVVLDEEEQAAENTIPFKGG
jgi:hypothetical protein